MKTKTIFDFFGRVLACIELHDAGHTVLRGPDRGVHAYYDADSDCTRDALNRIVGRRPD